MEKQIGKRGGIMSDFMSGETKTVYLCNECHGTDLSFTGWVKWDMDRQEMVQEDEPMIPANCNTCYNQVDVIEITGEVQ